MWTDVQQYPILKKKLYENFIDKPSKLQKDSSHHEWQWMTLDHILPNYEGR